MIEHLLTQSLTQTKEGVVHYDGFYTFCIFKYIVNSRKEICQDPFKSVMSLVIIPKVD
jgi:hypothetical protein